MKGFPEWWLLPKSNFDVMAAAFERFEFDQERYEAFIERSSRNKDGDAAAGFIIDGDTARIPVIGTLTKEPDFFFSIFGGGSAVYGDIIQAVKTADGNPDIKRIVLEIDSPGGEVAGFFDTARAIEEAETPIVAQVTDLATSAAFGLAAVTDTIIVNNRMAMVGSVGIVTTQFVSENRVTVASTDAPKKAPDASTEDGKSDIRETLDAIHEEFAGIIAHGRGVTSEVVNKTFGRGATVIATDALRANMIDGINSEIVGEPAVAAKTETKHMADVMTLEELRASNPKTYAEVFALGVAEERDRVSAHVAAGTACGHLEIAAEYITSGEALTQTATARYMTSGINKTEADARNDEDPKVPAGDPSGTGDPKADDAEAKAKAENELFDTLENNFGVSPSA